jgi:chorismate mutase / prephenate dehydratase
MTLTAAPELDELRREVDRIDRSILELLSARLRVVAEIAQVKGTGPGQLALRPAREALIMRRLVDGRAGDFPKAALLRMWRELLGAMTRVQSPLAVAAWLPPGMPELRDMVRDHFGSLAPLLPADGPADALRLAARGAAQVAVLPLPSGEERWWAALPDGAAGDLRVVARLPFAPLPGYPEGLGAFVLAPLEPEPSGDDLTLLATENDGSVGSAQLCEMLAPLAPRVLASHREGGRVLHLVEVAGFLAPDDPRLAILGPLLRVVVAGCYARPLAAAALE